MPSARVTVLLSKKGTFSLRRLSSSVAKAEWQKANDRLSRATSLAALSAGVGSASLGAATPPNTAHPGAADFIVHGHVQHPGPPAHLGRRGLEAKLGHRHVVRGGGQVPRHLLGFFPERVGDRTGRCLRHERCGQERGKGGGSGG